MTPSNDESTFTIIERIENNILKLNANLKLYTYLYDNTIKNNLDKASSLKTKIKDRLNRVL